MIGRAKRKCMLSEVEVQEVISVIDDSIEDLKNTKASFKSDAVKKVRERLERCREKITHEQTAG